MTRVSIGTHEYAVDLTGVIRRPINSLRQTVDQGSEVGEQSLNNGALWKRTSNDFVLGQNQQFFDQEEESNRRRSRAVSGFDPLSNRRALAVAPTCANVVAVYAGGTSGTPKLLETRSNWWIVPTGTGQLRRTASLTSFTTTNVTGGGTWTDGTVFGDTVYVCNGTDVYSGSITGSSVTSFSTVDTTVMDATLGRLVCGHNNELFELSSTGTKITIFTHPNTVWRWRSFAVGNAGIYAAGDDGLRSEIYLITVIDATGALAPPSPVATLPTGELIRTIRYFGGFLVMGTSKGVRLAQAAQSGLLQYGPIIELGDTYGISFEGRFAYATCTALPTFGGPGVVVLSLERFTAPLTPAFAASYPISQSGYTGYGVGTNGGQVVALLGNGTNVGLYSTASSYGTATYWSGQITYGTPEPKQFQSLEVTFDALTSGQSVTASVYNKQGGTQLATATTSTVGATKLTVTGTSSQESFEVQIVATGAVTIRRWTLRAVVAPLYSTEEIILPLLLRSQVGDDDGSTVSLDPLAEWNYLAGLMTSREATTLTFGSTTSTVWVDQVGVEQGWTLWDRRDRWPEGTVFVRLLTVGGG